MPEEEKIKLVCSMAAAMFPAIYKNRRAVSYDTHNQIVDQTAACALRLYNQIKNQLDGQD